MQIQIDSREHKSERERIERQFDKLGVEHFCSKLYVGDYMLLDNPRFCIDRKKDLQELCGNVCQQHERFRAELIRAQKAGIKLIILCEHGPDIQDLSDVYFWDNPRLKESPKATTGESLYKSLMTIKNRYNVRFEFCTKKETGNKIMELLNDGEERQRVDKTL
jgi:ERCC4-type nuclease